MLEAANQGALPSEGPVTKAFTPGNRKLSVREEYEVERASQMCGRMEGKLKQLMERECNLLGRGGRSS